MWKPLMTAGLLAAVISLQAEPEIKGSPTELSVYLPNVPKWATITGEAEVKTSADRALISLNVVTENRSLQEASRSNQEIRGRMLRALAESGVAADRVKAAKFSSTPKYGMFGEKAKSYRVENVVRITATDEKEFRAVAGLVDSIPEVRYDSIEFEHSNKDELKNTALAQALDKATMGKQIFEEKLSLKLVPKGFTETVAAYSVQDRIVVSKSTAPITSLPGYRADSMPAEGPSLFGELIYRGHVTVEYAVESK